MLKKFSRVLTKPERRFLQEKIEQRKVRLTDCDLSPFQTRILQKFHDPFKFQFKNAEVISICLNGDCSQKIIAKALPFLEISSNRDPASVEPRLIRMLTKNVLDKNQSPHIVRYLGAFGCRSDTPLYKSIKGINQRSLRNQLVVLIAEFVDSGDIADFLNNKTDEMSDTELTELLRAMIFQVIYTLAVLQERFKFMHNDLHTGNVLIQSVKNIKKNEVIEYTFKGQKYFVPRLPFIPKLWDFDFATTFDSDEFENIKVVKDTYRNYGIRPEFNPSYDLHFFLQSLLREFIPDAINVFIRTVFPPEFIGKRTEFVKRNRLTGVFPFLPTPAEVLQHPFFEKFTQKGNQNVVERFKL